MIYLVDRLSFDATRCEVSFSKGVASNIEEAVAEIKRLRAEIALLKATLDCYAAEQARLRSLLSGIEIALARDGDIDGAMKLIVNEKHPVNQQSTQEPK